MAALRCGTAVQPAVDELEPCTKGVQILCLELLEIFGAEEVLSIEGRCSATLLLHRALIIRG